MITYIVVTTENVIDSQSSHYKSNMLYNDNGDGKDSEPHIIFKHK